MRVILSAAVSLDGCLDDCSPDRLVLSSAEDWQEVYRLRASCDAILIGAGTLRADNPSLVLKDEESRRQRIAAGRSADPIKVVVSGSGKLDPSARFFRTGDCEKIVVTEARDLDPELEEQATVLRLEKITAVGILSQLALRGIEILLVEGGSQILTLFLGEGAFDRFRLAIAPFFVDDECAPRLKGVSGTPLLRLERVERLGETAVSHYRGESGIPTDVGYLVRAIALSRCCTPSTSAFSVGAVILTRDGRLFEGFTHETGARNHAEEEAIAKALAAGADLRGTTIYSSLEPCSRRASKPLSCTEHIINYGFARVVFACREPGCFVDCEGAEKLIAAGVEVREIAALADEVKRINAHLAFDK